MKNQFTELKIVTYKKMKNFDPEKALAEKLALHEDTWNEDLHSVKGGFKREDYCFRGSGPNRFEECCGDKTTFPFNQPRRTNQCCEGTEAKPEGTCTY